MPEPPETVVLAVAREGLAPVAVKRGVTVSGATTRASAPMVPWLFDTVTVAVCPAESRTMIGKLLAQTPVVLKPTLSPLFRTTWSVTMNAVPRELRTV